MIEAMPTPTPNAANLFTVRQQRELISRHALLSADDPADAPSTYYALYHDPQRSVLRADPNGQGFVGRFQTGVDLFRPLVTLFCKGTQAAQVELAADLLANVLTVGRPYLFFVPMSQLPLAAAGLQLQNQRIFVIYALDRRQFKSEINILVRREKAADGSPRAVIAAQGVQAVAGVNWLSPAFAEIYVSVDAPARGKGWGRSVVMACADMLLAGGRLPLYLVEPDNQASVQLAHSVGFQSTGARQVFADALYEGHPLGGGQPHER
jgi:GNAT superfamily N-acetyltransferase